MKIVSYKVKDYWRRTKHFCLHNILHADDPPHNLALGIGIGLFVALLPLIGIQMMLSLALSWPFRANKVLAVSLVWISNPITMIPIYYPGYWLGCQLIGLPVGGRWIEMMQSEASGIEKWKQFVAELSDFAGPLFLGTAIIAAVIGVISYYVSLAIIRSYRLRRWGQLMPPNLTPANLTDDPATPSGVSPRSENAA